MDRPLLGEEALPFLPSLLALGRLQEQRGCPQQKQHPAHRLAVNLKLALAKQPLATLARLAQMEQMLARRVLEP